MKVLRNLNQLLIVCSLLSATVTFATEGEKYLSSSQQELLEIERKLDDVKSRKLKYDWVNPIVASYSYSKNDQLKKENSARYFRISFDQPLFKSGGIYFAIKYAGANRGFLQVSTKIKDQKIIQSLYNSVLSLKKIDLQIQKLKLSDANSKLDVKRKKEQFESGELDSSFLDSAIIASSKIKQQILDLEEKKFSLLQDFKNISDVDYKEIELPSFTLVDREEFIQNNLELHQLKSASEQSRYIKNMTISNYLPTISLFGDYNNRKDDFRMFAQNNEYKNYGIRASMPIFDINMFKNIEIKKLEYLKSQLEFKEKRKTLQHEFAKIKNRIEVLNKREKIANDDVSLYSSLVASARDGVSAGDKTEYDLKNLQNSYRISQIDASIYEIDVQLEFLKLYAKISDAI
jgi:outer membrane protein TolC